MSSPQTKIGRLFSSRPIFLQRPQPDLNRRRRRERGVIPSAGRAQNGFLKGFSPSRDSRKIGILDYFPDKVPPKVPPQNRFSLEEFRWEIRLWDCSHTLTSCLTDPAASQHSVPGCCIEMLHPAPKLQHLQTETAQMHGGRIYS